MNLPFNLRDELTKLRALELAALKADNAVLRQRCKIFPPLEAEVGKALSTLEKLKNRTIIEAVKEHGNKCAAADALGIGRSTIYKRLRKLNGAAKFLSIVVLVIAVWLSGCTTTEPRLDTLPEPPMPVQPPWQPPVFSTPTVGKSVTLAWDISPSTNAIGYKIYYGLGATTNVIDAGGALTLVIPGLTPMQTYHFSATAYTAEGLESVKSDELVYMVPDWSVRIILLTATNVSGPWMGIVTNTIPATNAQQYFNQNIQLR